MKKTKDETIGVIIHLYMKMSQGNSLCTYIYFKLKYHVFRLILPLFSPTKLEYRRKEQVLPKVGGLASVGGGRW
jgi:hypothetical protein